MQNKISFSIESTKMSVVQDSINAIDSNLNGLVTLSEEERKGLPRFGDKSIGFVDKALEFGKQRPDVLPKYLSLTEMEKDVIGRSDLRRIISPLKALLERLEDSYNLAGIESFIAALAIYEALKNADHDGEPGLRTMIDELQKRFPGRSTATTQG